MNRSLYEEMKPRTVPEALVAFGLIFGFQVARMYVMRSVFRAMR